MYSSIAAKRKNDAVITVKQNNDGKSLEIAGLNPAAEKLTGYSMDDVVNSDFMMLLPVTIRDAVAGNIEFENDGNDLATVLRKVPEFKLLNKENKNVNVSLKIFYVISSETAKPEFELLMRDIRLLKKIEELKNKAHEEENVDSLQDDKQYDFVANKITLANNYVKDENVEVTFAILKADQYESLFESDGDIITEKVDKYLIDTVQGTLRTADICSPLSDGMVGIMLFDCNGDDACGVFNRLLSKIKATSSENLALDEEREVSLTASIGFMQLNGLEDASTTIKLCEQALEEAENNGGCQTRKAVDTLLQKTAHS